MCAILDNDLRDAVFGNNPAPADREFLRWIEMGRGRLVVGGQLTRELSGNEKVRKWLGEAEMLGIVKLIDNERVDTRAANLRNGNMCQSDDEHVIALALESGARLLHSNDRALRADFRNPNLISQPRGALYPRNRAQGDYLQWLINHGDLCRR